MQLRNKISRRGFLAGAGAFSLLAGCQGHPLGQFLGAMQHWNEKVEGLIFSPSRLAPELPASATTPEEAFPAYFISDSMPLAPTGWMLKVGGLVKRPMLLSLQQLQAMRRTDMRVQHHCVEGWSAVASWHGVRVSEVARLVGIDRRVQFVEFRSFDSGYWSSWDLGSALHPQTLLAYGFNGGPLYAEHGAPLRVYSAVKLGYKSVKYLTEVNFLPNRTGGYWEDQGYEWFAGV
ncbi:MAG TPA: molybdopterin-dependent oxidoreductase [Candidatus Binataceae bacterium]|nr:molybdopterin-dependent oxidoreductase [Candidatus Binataceae bacterium]